MIDMGIDARSMRLLEQAMKGAEKHTSKTFRENADKAMYFIARSAGAAMKPKGKTKREIIENPGRTGRGRRAKGSKYLIKVLHQSKPATYINANKKSDKRRTIKLLGLASTVMRIAAGKFGKQPPGKKTKGARKFVKTMKRLAGRRYAAKIEARLSYLLDAFPGVIDAAMKKGLTSFIRTFDKDWATALKRDK